MLWSALLRFPLRSQLLRPCHLEKATHPRTVLAIRSYATPGRPKSVVGEPSRKPIRRTQKTVKKDAAKTPAAKANAPKKKKKKTAAPAKKVLTVEQKAARKEKDKAVVAKSTLRDLKAAALDPPLLRKASAYAMLVKEQIPGKLSGPAVGVTHSTRVGQSMRECSALWKGLDAAGKEHYNHMANQKREADLAAHRKWVLSHTAEEIHAANTARQQLRRVSEKTKKPAGWRAKWAKIADPREVKRPSSAYLIFSTARNVSGDMHKIAFGDRAKLIASEWKALTAEEKMKYLKMQQQEQKRYVAEYKETYGHDSPAASVAVAA